MSNENIKIITDRSDIVAIADAVRLKTGINSQMTLSQIIAAINSIESASSGNVLTLNEYGFYFDRLYVSEDNSTAVGFLDNVIRIYTPVNINPDYTIDDDGFEVAYANDGVTYSNLLGSFELMGYTVDAVFTNNGEKVVIEMLSAAGFPTEYTISTNTKPIRSVYYGDVYTSSTGETFVFNEDGTYESSIVIPDAVSVLEWDNYNTANLDEISNYIITGNHDGEKVYYKAPNGFDLVFTRQS